MTVVAPVCSTVVFSPHVSDLCAPCSKNWVFYDCFLFRGHRKKTLQPTDNELIWGYVCPSGNKPSAGIYLRWAFNLGCSTRFSSQTPSLKTWRAKVWAKKSETMKSRPHPYFWKWKIKVQKNKFSVSGVCWKLKMAHEMKTAVLSVCWKNLKYKIKTSPENAQPHPFHPTQLLCLPKLFNWCLVGM